MDEKRDGTGSSTQDGNDVSRREFLGSTGAVLVVAGAQPAGSSEARAEEAVEQQARAAPRTSVSITVNGLEHSVEVEDRWTLNELLRDHLELTGSKLGCERGECGACTVLVDGQPVYSCSTLAVWADGRSVRTVEGLEREGEVSYLQQAFMDYNAPQCGFCTPGQLMAATALLERNPYPTSDDVREALVGNLCRCSNYNAIVEAVLAAAGTSAAGGGR
ncbi:MAG TPA: (2Fe-2S)-binding protein [Longimicrobiales bacterium]|nr:(2Fe-2S)-binding protein [Longimicrobiales bacterium]